MEYQDENLCRASGVLCVHNTRGKPRPLGKGGASPSRCIPPEQGAFRAPRAPHDQRHAALDWQQGQGPCTPHQVRRRLFFSL
jgi:hypothetical protein